LSEYGTISQRDVDQLYFTDSVEDAFNHIVKCLNTISNKVH
jgi:hypothetical protein